MSNLSEIQGWKKALLESLGGTYTGLSGKTKDDFGEGKPFITYMNVFSNSKIKPDQVGYVKILEEESQSKVQYGDILFTTSSETVDEVGMTSVMLSKGLEEVYLNSFCFGFRLHDFSQLLPEYASFLFRSEAVRKTITVLSQGSTRFNLSKTALLKKLWLELPPLSEQQKIAEILSTVDEKIEVIEEKISKTQELKKGLMQVLLTKGMGHTKFKNSGFGEIPESWQIKSFNYLVDNITKKFDGTEGRCIDLEHVEQNTGKILGYDNIVNRVSSKNQFTTGDVLFGKLRPYLRKYWYAEFDGCCSSELMVFRARNMCDPKFIFYTVQLDSFIANAVSKSYGTKMPRTSWQIISGYRLAVPPIDEQKKISTMLSLIDEKLEVLESKKHQAIEIKKGLMQQLLTGKIRVNSLIQKQVIA